MKHLKILIPLFLILLQSCEKHDNFDAPILDGKYFHIFAESVDQIALDNPAVSARGWFYNTKLRCYSYMNDIVDTVDDRRLYLLHQHDGKRIYQSYVDSITFTTYNKRSRIIWDIDEIGLIHGCEKYDRDNNLISSEKYVNDFNELAYKSFDSLGYYGGYINRIVEKQKFDANGKLIRTIKYTYNDNNSYEIEIIEN